MQMYSTEPAIRWDERSSAWFVVGHAPAEAALVDRHLSLRRRIDTERPARTEPPDARGFLESWFSAREPAEHAAIRQRLHQAYAERRIRESADLLAEVAAEVAAELPDGGDLMASFFGPFAIRSTARLVGIPADQMAPVSSVVTGLTTFMHHPSYTPRTAGAIERCARYLRGLVEVLFTADRPTPTVTALRSIAEAPGADVWDAVATLAQLLTAGYEPTTSGAALAWLAVNRRPGEGEPGPDVAEAIAGTLRDTPPFPRLYRTASADCGCLGVPIRAGSTVIVDVTAANRDPAGRGRPLSFGHGPHHCVGASLARLQMEVALRALARVRPAIRTVEQQADLVDVGHLVQLRSLPFHRLAVAGGVHG